MRKMIYFTSTEKNTAVQAVESGSIITNLYDVVIFATHREAKKYAEKRDGKKNSNGLL